MTEKKPPPQGAIPRVKRPPKKLDPAELATILAYAGTHTDKAAAEKFGLSTRTILRHKEAIRDGKAPELAALVAQQKQVAYERCADLLTETYELSLRRLQELLPTATGQLALDSAKVLGELRITRGFFGESESDPARSRVAAAAGADGGGAEAPGPSPAPVH